MPVESERVHLQDRRTLRAHVVDRRATDAQDILHVLTVDEHAGNAIVLALVENLLVRRDILGEGVDRATVIDHQEKNRQVFLRRRVQALCHAPVLGATFADEDDCDAVVRVVAPEHLVEDDGSRRTDRVRQLLRDERPPTLKVRIHVVHVHRTPGTSARATVLTEQLRHYGAAIHTARQGVAMVAVVRVLQIILTDRVRQERRNRLLTVVKVHETANLTRHVRLVALVFKVPAQLHHVIRLAQILITQVLTSLQLLIRRPELFLQHLFRLIPRRLDAKSLQIRRRSLCLRRSRARRRPSSRRLRASRDVRVRRGRPHHSLHRLRFPSSSRALVSCVRASIARQSTDNARKIVPAAIEVRVARARRARRGAAPTAASARALDSRAFASTVRVESRASRAPRRREVPRAPRNARFPRVKVPVAES